MQKWSTENKHAEVEHSKKNSWKILSFYSQVKKIFNISIWSLLLGLTGYHVITGILAIPYTIPYHTTHFSPYHTISYRPINVP
jgi:hypothetical protein